MLCPNDLSQTMPIASLSIHGCGPTEFCLEWLERLGAILNTHSHLEESLQRDIEHLRAKIGDMAGLAERALRLSMQAFIENSRRLAYSVILRDQYIDELETEVDRMCLEFLLRHQPVGTHLRLAYATIHINRQLERIGDYAESIAKQVLLVSATDTRISYDRFVELSDLAQHMLRNAVRSFLREDSELARSTMAIEERANSLRTSINSELISLGQAGQLSPEALNPLMTIARRLERAADQAKNLCEEVLYLCTGEFIKHKKAEGFRLLFLDYTDACLGPMAEGVGKSLGLPRFAFESAGRAPQPIHPHTIQFMREKGVDLSGQTSKSLEQVPNWENFQLIIALDPRALDGLTLRSSKPIVLTWSIQDPLEVEGSAETRKAAFENAFQSIQSNLKDLAAAILDGAHP
jgi:phosphate transport system protein